MLKQTFRNSSPFSKFLLSLFFIISSYLFTLIIGSMLAVPIFGINFFQHPEILADISNPDYVPFFKYFQIVQSIGIFIIPPLIAALIFGDGIKEYYGFNKKLLFIIIILVFALMFVIQPLISFLINLNENISLPSSLKSIEVWMQNSEDKAGSISEIFLQMSSPLSLLLNIIIMALIPAIGEELLFRGLLQKIFNEWFKNIHIAVIVSAFLFSAMHLQFYGFIPRFLLGILFGYLFVWSGTLWLPIIAHFINNASAVIVSYLFQNNFIATDYKDFGDYSNNYLIISFSAIITALIIYNIYKYRKTSNKFNIN